MKVCPNCQAENRDTARFCTTCAAAFLTGAACPACGSTISSVAKFCGKCGATLPPAPASGVGTGAPSAGAQAGLMATGRLPANTLVAERYLIVQRIGKGGMGAVYLVKDTRLGDHKCALKEMSTAALKTPQEQQEAVKAFRRESQILSSLSHPNLPRVTDFFSEGSRHFLVVDFVEGDTLQDLIDARTQPYPEAQVLQWADQLCDVLAYLHSQNPPVIFRDLKPGNIMIAPDGKTVKLIDFGIARVFRPGASKDTQALGTPGYAAPEQYGKGQSDERSDVYALGATMHYLLSMRDPSIEPMKFPRLRTLNPNVSASVETTVHRALEMHPSSRWQTAREMRSALQAQVVGYSGVSAAASAQQRGAPPATVVGPQPAGAPFQRTPQSPVVVAPAPTSVTPLPPPGAGPIYNVPYNYSPRLYADNGARFAAYIIDSILVSLGYFVLALPLGLIGDDALFLFYSMIILAWGMGYYTFFHARGGQTPGKRLMKIRVVRRDGSPLSVGRALWRAAAFLVLPVLLTVVCFIGWLMYLVPLFEKEHRALHDLVADTWVVKA